MNLIVKVKDRQGQLIADVKDGSDDVSKQCWLAVGFYLHVVLLKVCRAG